MASSPLPPLPAGSEHVAAWARARGLKFQPRPDPGWFSGWEPYDTMTSPEAYYSAASWPFEPGTVTLAEPWFAPVDTEPLDRTVLCFVSHPGFVRRASARAGEHFNTRVTYLENPPAPTVQLGDPSWDGRIHTLAASSSEATMALPRAARRLLLDWGFCGHLEVRPGGMVVHFAGLRAVPEHLDRLRVSVPELALQLLRPDR